MTESKKTAERLIQEINRRAVLYCNEAYTAPTSQDLMVVRNAMLIGAEIVNNTHAEELRAEIRELERG